MHGGIGFRDRIHRRKLLSSRSETPQIAHEIRALIANGTATDLQPYLEQVHPADLALAMNYLYDAEKQVVFSLLHPHTAAQVLDDADPQTEEHLLETTAPQRLADIIDELPPDEGADIVGEMDYEQAEAVLGLMEPEESAEIRALLRYPKDTAGGIMSSEVVAVTDGLTREQALEWIQRHASAESIFYVYVVDEAHTLKGVLDLRRLLACAPGTSIRDLTTHGIVFVFPEFDQEQVAEIFARYDLLALPVVNHAYKLLGIITADDVIDVIHAEHIEDQLRMGGTDVAELEATTPLEIARIRLPWLLPCLLGSLLSGAIISAFTPALSIGSRNWLLTLAPFIPFIMAMGGNAGTQTTHTIIRELSNGNIRRGDVWRVLREEMIIGAYMGFVCGVIACAIATWWKRDWVVGISVGLGMLGGILAGKTTGTLLPVTLHRLKQDPAIGAGPFVTTSNDSIGVLIYLGLATLLLHHLRS